MNEKVEQFIVFFLKRGVVKFFCGKWCPNWEVQLQHLVAFVVYPCICLCSTIQFQKIPIPTMSRSRGRSQMFKSAPDVTRKSMIRLFSRLWMSTGMKNAWNVDVVIADLGKWDKPFTQREIFFFVSETILGQITFLLFLVFISIFEINFLFLV